MDTLPRGGRPHSSARDDHTVDRPRVAFQEDHLLPQGIVGDELVAVPFDTSISGAYRLDQWGRDLESVQSAHLDLLRRYGLRGNLWRNDRTVLNQDRTGH